MPTSAGHDRGSIYFACKWQISAYMYSFRRGKKSYHLFEVPRTLRDRASSSRSDAVAYIYA